jgi:nucleotide-binding universal stress UspA family protein
METPMGSAPVAMLDSDQISAQSVKEEQEGQKLVEGTLSTLQAAGKSATGILKRGDAATEIIAAVKEHNIDLLITGSRGHSPIREWVMGSVSRKLVHYSGCSVMVVRQPHAD